MGRDDNVILVSALHPLLNHRLKVQAESILVPAPHVDSGVITPRPTSRLPHEDAMDRQSLHPLLAQTLPVKCLGRGSEVGVWKECLHVPSIRLSDGSRQLPTGVVLVIGVNITFRENLLDDLLGVFQILEVILIVVG